jgi:hypothetical protein
VLDHTHGEGVRMDFSRLHPGRTGGSFDYSAHVLSRMSEMGGAGISALYFLYYILWHGLPQIGCRAG